jgi:hypothetical protein
LAAHLTATLFRVISVAAGALVHVNGLPLSGCHDQSTSFCRRRSGSRKGSKHLFSRPADRAFPILRKVFEPSPLGDFALPVAPVRIVDITAIRGLALPHLFGSGHSLLLLLQKETLHHVRPAPKRRCKHVPGRPADRASPAPGKVLESGPAGYLPGGVPVLRFVQVSANRASKNIHQVLFFGFRINRFWRQRPCRSPGRP